MAPANGTKEETAQAIGAPGVDSPAEVQASVTPGERRPGPDLNLIRAGATIIAILGVLALLHYAASVFITLFSSMLLAFALEPDRKSTRLNSSHVRISYAVLCL